MLLSDPGGGLRIHNRISAATNTLEIEPMSRVAFIAAASIRGCPTHREQESDDVRYEIAGTAETDRK